MMFFKFFFLFFLLFFYSNLFAKDGSAIALMYHRFEENKYPSTSISQKNFYSQLLYLKENNFNVSMIGDCTSVGYIEGAISDARIAVKEII